MAGCPKYLLSKLQKVQNNAARLIFRTTRSAHVTPMLHSLHWLPTEQRIEYKLSLLCFKIISHQAPIYLSELLHLYTPSRQLRSSEDTRAFRMPSSVQSPHRPVEPIFYSIAGALHTHQSHIRAIRTEEKVFKKRKVFKEDLKELTQAEWRTETGSWLQITGAW